uniref:Uncharacterized protein n=1 Tax=Rhizophora mucronata TaxID=61149 RepID=A0A2P2J416_RHIMU
MCQTNSRYYVFISVIHIQRGRSLEIGLAYESCCRKQSIFPYNYLTHICDSMIRD